MQYLRVLMLLLVVLCAVSPVHAEEPLRVQVVEPYIELRTGPGEGFPVTYVEEWGAWIELLVRKTDWIEVQTASGRRGWVHVSQMEQTITPAGEFQHFSQVTLEDFSRRRWEFGVMGGDFGGADLISVYGGYNFSAGLAAELSLSQALGQYSSSDYATLSVVAQPFPHWRWSPMFSLGTSVIKTTPQLTLVQAQNRTTNAAHVGVGVRTYLSRRFMLRLEYRNYVLFNSDQDNEEVNEWKAGFAIFY